MSKIFGMVAAAALFASVTAFAQTPSSAPPSDSASAPAAAPSDDSAKPEKPEKPMHKHHHNMAGMKAGTDENADKLNACMSNATPTSEQESCLKQASGTGNG